ncbi:serine/threonine-protein kinase [Actinomycetospora flava]|uniref:non-specific serine/threonine protein kinase n=1 Tax=Actinomycetospora flava TaxID=3129232 RepID=A0ABU8LY97_9PSEU
MQHQPRTSRLHGPVAAPSTMHDAAPVPVDTSVVGTVLGGRYRVGECIGAGAMGVVFTAWDRRLRRTVAIKQLAARGYRDATEERVARARAMREGRIAARVVHPRAIAVFDVVVDDAGPWLVMEYLPSRSLAAVLAAQGPLEPAQAAWIGAQVAEALGAVHEAGIVHGDIKPGNVLITDEGVAKITDFGVSRATWDTTSTGGGMVAGTPGYFAPEVARGGDPSPASDVFSLGATLYAAVENQLVCGHHDNTLAVLHAMAEGKLRPAERAGVLGRPLAAMLRLDPSHRPDTAAVERALRARAGSTPFIPAPVDDGDDAAESADVAVPAPRPTGTADLPVGAVAMGEEPAALSDGIDPAPAPVPVATVPPPAPAPMRPAGGDRRRPSRRPSRRVVAVTAASALVLAGGIGVGVALAATGGGTVAAPAPSTTAPRAAAPASAPDSPPPSVAAPVSPGEPAPATVVVDYYAALPGDIDRAWSTLSERAQDESGGYGGYQRFWSGIREVRTANVEARGTTVFADIEFTTASGRTSRETYRFEVDKDSDGQIRIQRAQRSSSDSM